MVEVSIWRSTGNGGLSGVEFVAGVFWKQDKKTVKITRDSEGTNSGLNLEPSYNTTSVVRRTGKEWEYDQGFEDCLDWR